MSTMPSDPPVMHRVTVLPGATVIDCRDGETLLAATKRSAGKLIAFGCEGGGCGLCRVTLVSGDIRRGKMSRAHVTLAGEQQGATLACRTYPTSDIVIALEKSFAIERS